MGRTILSSITTTSFIYKVVGKMTATEAPVVSAPQVQDGKSPVKEKKPEEVQEEATTFLTTGKRHLLVKDIPAAVSEFAQACELLSATFGETGKECAESYYYYGRALLEMSRLESGVLGNALDGVPEEEDEANSSKVEDPAKMTDEEKKEVAEKVGEALKENLVELEKKDEENQTEDNKTIEDKDEVAKEDEGKRETRKRKTRGWRKVQILKTTRNPMKQWKQIRLSRERKNLLLRMVMKKRQTRRMKRKNLPIYNCLGKCLSLPR